MQIVTFSDQIDAVAQLHGRSVEDQLERDARQAQQLQRWLAFDGATAVATVTTWLRPDDRLFLMPAWADARALALLSAHVGDELGRSVSMGLDLTDDGLIGGLERVGFEIETVSEAFEIPFEPVLAVVRRTKRTSGYSIAGAGDVDEHRLFELDNQLRNLVAGTDGWVGDPDWFHDELTESPPFDPTTYLVAVHEDTDAYVGLIRIWRNPTGPRLGLLGVLPQHRSSSVAGMLLYRALEAAAGWGHDTFVTETGLHNRVVHSRLEKYGGISRGRFAQLTRAGP